MPSTEKYATIYIVRHGQTVGNTQNIVLHPNEDVLSDVGKQQAQLLSTTLKDVNFTKVYTSDYIRTKQTANIILDSTNTPFPRTEMKVESRLREIDMESTLGKPYSFVLEELLQFLQSEKPLDDFKIDNSEPIPEIRQRAKEAMKEIFQDAFLSLEPQTVLIVSHAVCIRMIMQSLYQCEEFKSTGWDPCGEKIIRNTGFMKLTVAENDGKMRINFEKFHQVYHLPKEMLETDSLTKLSQTPKGKCLSGCFQV